MNLYVIQYFVYGAGLIFCTVGFIIAARGRATEEQKLVMILFFTGFLVQLGHWSAVQSPVNSIDMLVFATKLQYFGTCMLYSTFLIFGMRYFQVALPSWLYWVIVVVSMMFVIITLTFDKHQLFYVSYHVENIDGIHVLVKKYGIFHTLYYIMIVLANAAFTAVFVKMIKAGNKNRTRTNLLLYLAAIMPSICYFIGAVFRIKSFKMVPVGITIASGICLYLITVRKYLDIKNVAQTMLINSLEDAIIVVDTSYCLEHYNTCAANVFPVLKTIKIKEPFIDKTEKIRAIYAPLLYDHTEDVEDYESGGQIYKPEVKPIVDSYGKIEGYILGLQNVTIEREKERLLESYNNSLRTQVAIQTRRLSDIQDEMIRGFATLAEGHSLDTGKHVRRTSSYAWIIATEMMRKNMHADIIDDEWIETLRKVAPLHDIGKIAITDAILNKPGKLTQEEYVVMKTHTVIGAEIIQTIMKNNDAQYVEMASNVAKYHHEKWDGTGYPEGLAGKKIPLEARIVAVADVFDAIVSKRAYKEASQASKAFDIIDNDAGTHFDPEIVQVFLDCFEEIIEVYEELKD
ncbi:MAG: HD domain-containing protein [Treponema sp.]|nr:HD domain-containing protein [Treponema sp.]